MRSAIFAQWPRDVNCVIMLRNYDDEICHVIYLLAYSEGQAITLIIRKSTYGSHNKWNILL